ncbi:hypothetical protein Patl1_14433 [Pistacia atlantica]|uniref:Uncharacterized protein n=1 Tax=Pistacia atlantica TaxID=434234 RepID=A0ACC1AY21_9ROSI|nr:hypothetical protein Patl1_14433 [Pistacia atlantica]
MGDPIELKTAPADFRFPTTNQTRHCFTRYIEFHRCLAAKGEESNECERFAKYYRSLCPGEWMIATEKESPCLSDGHLYSMTLLWMFSNWLKGGMSKGRMGLSQVLFNLETA